MTAVFVHKFVGDLDQKWHDLTKGIASRLSRIDGGDSQLNWSSDLSRPPGGYNPQFSRDTPHGPNHLKFKGGLSGCVYGGVYVIVMEWVRGQILTWTNLFTLWNNCTKFGHFILRNIAKIVATRCHILQLKCTIRAPAIVWAPPLIESIKCYFMPT